MYIRVDNGYWNKSIRPWRRTSEHGYESELQSSCPHALSGKKNSFDKKHICIKQEQRKYSLGAGEERN